MIARLAIATAIAMVASAAPAADIRTTHAELRLPPAKGLLPVYRQIAPSACPTVKAVQVTPPGKMASPVAACR
ncbi:MAG: hypothetical protein JWR77_1780 [Rhizorhabdus sp.]|nr:hypothetical protein [Rhizorhabdus sp.]